MVQDPVKTVFVGREQELDAIQSALDGALGGSAQLLLLLGEPGIGKTRLAEEAAVRARELDAKVLWGSCWEGDGAPAFWPWEQVIRAYVEDQASASLLSELGPELSDVTRFLPELRESLPPSEWRNESGSGEPGQLRFRVFDTVRRFLERAAQQQPLVIILDDLHRADRPSLILLQFVMSQMHRGRILVIGTYRDADLTLEHPLALAMGELVRLRATEKLLLRGLREVDVRRFMAEIADETVVDAWVGAVFGKSDGNPFFMTELVRLLGRDGLLSTVSPKEFDLEIPQTIREVVRCRLARLSEHCSRVLGAAAVIGREFDLQVVRQVLETSPANVIQALDEGIGAGVLNRVSELRGRHRFTHVLIRDTLYDEHSTSRRIELHHKVAQVLEDLNGGDLDSTLPMLAHHYLHGTVGGDASKAIEYVVRAGRHASQALAYEEAALYFRRALDALGCSRQRALDRCRILLDLGDAQNRAGDVAQARETFLDAASLARRMADVELFCRAALGFGWEARTGFVDKTLVGLLDEALELLDTADSALRVSILSRLARALYWSGSPERSLELSQNAVEMANRVGSGEARAIALSARYIALWGPDAVEQRRCVTQMLQVSVEGLDNPETESMMLRFSIMDLLEQGELDIVLDRIKRHEKLALAARVPFLTAESRLLHGMYATLTGNFVEAEEHSREALLFAHRLQSQMLGHSAFAQLVTLRRLQELWLDLEPLIMKLVREYPALPVWRAVLCCVLADQYPARARREIDRVLDDHISRVPRDGNWLVFWTLISEASISVAHKDAIGLTYRYLKPFASCNIVIGYGAACDGPVAYYLGRLAAQTNDLDSAVEHFREALGMAMKLGAQPLVARTQHRFAESLMERQGPNDLKMASELLSAAVPVFRNIGMRVPQRRALILRRALVKQDGGKVSRQTVTGNRLKGSRQTCAISTDLGRSVADADGERQEVANEGWRVRNVLRYEGDCWTFEFGGRTLRVRSRKGMLQLAYLIAHPGLDVLAYDLAGISQKGCGLDGVMDSATLPRYERALMDDVGPIADIRARRQYQCEVAVLSEQVEEAERANERQKVTLLRERIDQIQSELLAGFKGNGQPRVAGLVHSRARVAVRNNIVAVLKAICRQDEALWRHLFTSVRTGSLCSYRTKEPILCTWSSG